MTWEPTELEQIEEGEKELEIKREKYYNDLEAAIRHVSNSPEGRRVLREIVSWCGLFDAVSPDEEKVTHAEGRRFIGIQLKTKLDSIDMEIFPEMMLEGVRYEKALFGG